MCVSVRCEHDTPPVPLELRSSFAGWMEFLVWVGWQGGMMAAGITLWRPVGWGTGPACGRQAAFLLRCGRGRHRRSESVYF